MDVEKLLLEWMMDRVICLKGKERHKMRAAIRKIKNNGTNNQTKGRN